MRVEQLNEGIWAMTYLVECESSAKATLIDPVWDNMSDYLSVIEERGLSLEYAMATHTHADHITGCFKLAEMFGCEYVMWHDTPSLGVSIYVDEESNISMGDVDLFPNEKEKHYFGVEETAKKKKVRIQNDIDERDARKSVSVPHGHETDDKRRLF